MYFDLFFLSKSSKHREYDIKITGSIHHIALLIYRHCYRTGFKKFFLIKIHILALKLYIKQDVLTFCMTFLRNDNIMKM